MATKKDPLLKPNAVISGPAAIPRFCRIAAEDAVNSSMNTIAPAIFTSTSVIRGRRLNVKNARNFGAQKNLNKSRGAVLYYPKEGEPNLRSNS